MALFEHAHIKHLRVDEIEPDPSALKTGGDVYYVQSSLGSNTNSGKSPLHPFATMAYAESQMTADQGDVCYVLPGHAETISTDGGLTINIADTSWIGCGTGDQRPLITIGTLAAAAMVISGAGTRFWNFRISIAIDAATDPIQISAAGCDFGYCEIIEATACESLDLISLNASATRCKLHDLWIQGRNTADGDALNAIHLDGCDQVEIYNIFAFGGDWKEGVIKNEGDEALDLHIHDCYLKTAAPEDLCIILDAAATGWTHDIYCVLNDDAANIDECIVGAAMNFFDPILVVNAAGEKGIEWAGTDSTDA